MSHSEVTQLDSAKIARIRQSMRRLSEGPADDGFEAEFARRLQVLYGANGGGAPTDQTSVCARIEPAAGGTAAQNLAGPFSGASERVAAGVVASANVKRPEAPALRKKQIWTWPVAVAAGFGVALAAGSVWELLSIGGVAMVVVVPEPNQAPTEHESDPETQSPAFSRSLDSRSGDRATDDPKVHESELEGITPQQISPEPERAPVERVEVRLETNSTLRPKRAVAEPTPIPRSAVTPRAEISRLQPSAIAGLTSTSRSGREHTVTQQVAPIATVTTTGHVLQRLKINLKRPSKSTISDQSRSTRSRDDRVSDAERSNRLRPGSYTNRERLDDSYRARQRDNDRRDDPVDRDSARGRSRRR